MGTEWVLQNERSSGNCTVWMYLVPLMFILKNGYSGKFYVMCILPQLKEIKINENSLGSLECSDKGSHPLKTKIKHCLKCSKRNKILGTPPLTEDLVRVS